MNKVNKTYKKIFPYFTKLSFDELASKTKILIVY
jgi:hypothetical protein